MLHMPRWLDRLEGHPKVTGTHFSLLILL